MAIIDMRWNDLAGEDCSLARALAVVGDRWTLLILREAFLKVRRFEEFQNRLGIARRVLTERLAGLVTDGVLDRVTYQERPKRDEYRLTQKGLDLYPVILSLVHWGDSHYADHRGPPILHQHVDCGHDFKSVLTCSVCATPVVAKNVVARARERI